MFRRYAGSILLMIAAVLMSAAWCVPNDPKMGDNNPRPPAPHCARTPSGCPIATYNPNVTHTPGE